MAINYAIENSEEVRSRFVLEVELGKRIQCSEWYVIERVLCVLESMRMLVVFRVSYQSLMLKAISTTRMIVRRCVDKRLSHIGFLNVG